MRKRSLALYYRNKKTNGKHPKLSEAKQHRKERVDAMMKKYRKIYNRLKRLGVNPDNPKYTAGDIDEILRKDGFEDVEQTSLNFNSVDISTIGVRIAV
jgi:archaellum component FlaC